MSQQSSPVFAKQVDYYSPSSVQEGRDARQRSAVDPIPPLYQVASQPPRTANNQNMYSPSSPYPPPQDAAVVQQQLHQNSAAVPANRYAGPNDVPVNLTAARYRHRPWHYSLCVSCKEMDSCAEACCCLCCQMSRQCNMFMYNKREIHWPYCLLMSLTDLCTLHLFVTWIFASQTRRMSRERYGISGSCCNDCCVGCWCRTCSTQQVLLEMTVMNDFPGATCYNAVPQPMDFEMV
jgi:Cys-rich protein (TIGR01571 family)